MVKNLIATILIIGFYCLTTLAGEDTGLAKVSDKKLILWYQPVKTSDETVIRNRYKHYKSFLDGLIYTTGVSWKTPGENFDKLIEENYGGIPLRKRVEIAREEGLRENFIDILLFARKELQWVDEEKWTSAIALLTRVASKAKDIGCVGISLDVEPYGVRDGKGRIFSVGPSDLALKRGKEVGEAVFKEFPEAELMLIFPASFMTRKNFLYFVRGLAESPIKNIHMGWEEYYYSTKPDEIKAQDIIYNLMMMLVMGNDQKLLGKCGIAPGIWPGIYENRTRLTPQETRIDIKEVFKIAKRYVWLFPPGVDWLKETEYIEAIKPSSKERTSSYTARCISGMEFVQMDKSGKILNRIELDQENLKKLLKILFREVTAFMYKGGKQKISSRISGEEIEVKRDFILPEKSSLLIHLSDGTVVPLFYRGNDVLRLYPRRKLSLRVDDIFRQYANDTYFIDLEMETTVQYITEHILNKK